MPRSPDLPQHRQHARAEPGQSLACRASPRRLTPAGSRLDTGCYGLDLLGIACAQGRCRSARRPARASWKGGSKRHSCRRRVGVSLPEPATTGPVAVNVNSATATTSAASMTGKVDGNTIGAQGATDTGAKQGNGIRGWIQGQSVGVLGIYNNQIREVPNASPITVFGRTGTGSARFKVTGNVMPRPTGTNFDVGCAAPTTTPTPCPTNT